MANLSELAAGGNRQPVYVVDDDPSLRSALVRFLRSMKFEAQGFSSGQELLDSRVAAGAGCLILDIKMKEMSGLELQALLATQGVRVPIIFISAHADADARERAMRGGAIAVLAKPFSEKALVECLDRALGQSS